VTVPGSLFAVRVSFMVAATDGQQFESDRRLSSIAQPGQLSMIQMG